MKELIISRLSQIINKLDNTDREVDKGGAKYICISDGVARFMAREIRFASDYLVKNGYKDRHKQSNK